MKFEAVTECKLDEALLAQDFEAGTEIGRGKAGERCIYYPKLFHQCYIPYEQIVWAFHRVEEVKGTLCCGTAVFQLHKLIIVTRDKKELSLDIGEKPEVDAGLAAVLAHNTAADTGYTKEKKEKYL